MFFGARRPGAAGQFSRTSSWLAPIPPEVTITAWRLELELADRSRASWPCPRATRARLEDMAGDAGDRAAGDRQLVDPVAEAQLDQAAPLGLAHAAHERLDHPGAGAPGDVEARDGVAVAGRQVAAALGPADVREEAHALVVQPRALLAGGEVDVGLGPAPRPLVLGAVEPGRAQPVLPRQLARVVDPHPALLGAVDEEQPAEGPERLAAQRCLGLLVDEDHPPPGVGQLGGGDEARQAGPDHDRIGVHEREGYKVRRPRGMRLCQVSTLGGRTYRTPAPRRLVDSRWLLNAQVWRRFESPRRRSL